MQVKVNATHSDKVMLSQVSLYVSIGVVGDNGSLLLSGVTKKVEYLSDFMKKREGCIFELQSCGLRPHFVLKEEESGKTKTHEHVQAGYEAFASIAIHVPFGYAKLNPIADAVKYVHGSVTARYTMSDNMKSVYEGALRCKLMDKAKKQCEELLSRSDGSKRAGVVIKPVEVSYHVVEQTGIAAYKSADRASSTAMSANDDESGYDLDAIYTRENAPSVIMKDSVLVVFEVEGYEL